MNIGPTIESDWKVYLKAATQRDCITESFILLVSTATNSSFAVPGSTTLPLKATPGWILDMIQFAPYMRFAKNEKAQPSKIAPSFMHMVPKPRLELG